MISYGYEYIRYNRIMVIIPFCYHNIQVHNDDITRLGDDDDDDDDDEEEEEERRRRRILLLLLLLLLLIMMMMMMMMMMYHIKAMNIPMWNHGIIIHSPEVRPL